MTSSHGQNTQPTPQFANRPTLLCFLSAPGVAVALSRLEVFCLYQGGAFLTPALSLSAPKEEFIRGQRSKAGRGNKKRLHSNVCMYVMHPAVRETSEERPACNVYTHILPFTGSAAKTLHFLQRCLHLDPSVAFRCFALTTSVATAQTS